MLSQVKLFLREDCPSKVGAEHQDTLQAKTSWTLHPSGMWANDPPPGFEGGHYANGLKYDLAEMPSIQWTSPPKVSRYIYSFLKKCFIDFKRSLVFI